MSDGSAGNFELSSTHGEDFGSDPEPRRAWVTPELEELVPGTERYERAVAAFEEATANRDSDGGDNNQG